MELVWFEFEESEKRGEGRSHRSFNYRVSIVVNVWFWVLSGATSNRSDIHFAILANSIETFKGESGKPSKEICFGRGAEK